MKIIVPMAGMGKRMRPHTLTVPKPLLPVAGKPIVQRLVEDIARMIDDKLEEVAFVIGDFGKETEEKLLKIASDLGAKGSIYYQDEPLGTAHAILCAEDALEGRVIVAFADTLFRADFQVDPDKDGIIWVQKVEDPRAFGVVKIDDNNVITDFVEKPETFVSDLAIIGIYYFKDGAYLKEQIKNIINNNIKDKGEYQLTSALELMKQKGSKFEPGEVKEWLDCGNKNATVYTNKRVLEYTDETNLVSPTVKIENGKIIEPCFIGDNVQIKNSIVGPFVSVGENSQIENSVISNSIIQTNTVIGNRVFTNSMIGNFAKLQGRPDDISVGDYTDEQ